MESDSQFQSHEATQLSDLIVRRRLEAGEFTYLYKSLEKTISGKKSAYQFLKSQTEDFNSLRVSCRQLGETDEQFDHRMLKELQSLPFEEKKDYINCTNLQVNKAPRKKATYSNFVKSTSQEEPKIHITQSEGFILPPKKSSPPQSTKKLLQAPQIVKSPVELTPFEGKIENTQ
mgnify:CR=1 FL=1